MAFLQAGRGEEPFNFGSGGRPAMFDIPAVVLALLGVLAASHLARIAMPKETADAILALFGFVPKRVMALHDPMQFATVLTHAFVEPSLQELGLVCLVLVAFGSIVARRFGAIRFLALFALGAISSALLYLATDPQSPVILAGAGGAGACITISAIRMTWTDGTLPATDPPALLPVWSGRVLAFSIVWIAGAFLIGGGASGSWQEIVGGVLAGLAFSSLFDAFVVKRPIAHALGP